MDETRHARRRIDRVTAPDFLDGLEERTPAELRQMRDDCRAEESRVSYNRRLVQGQLDIARVEQQRRRRDADDDDTLLSELPSILADPPTTQARQARSAPLYTPPEQERRIEEAAPGGTSLANLPDLDDEELDALVTQLRASEQQLSTDRGVVLGHLDRLQAELVRRYRDGSVGVDEVVGPTPTDTRDEA